MRVLWNTRFKIFLLNRNYLSMGLSPLNRFLKMEERRGHHNLNVDWKWWYRAWWDVTLYDQKIFVDKFYFWRSDKPIWSSQLVLMLGGELNLTTFYVINYLSFKSQKYVKIYLALFCFKKYFLTFLSVKQSEFSLNFWKIFQVENSIKKIFLWYV